MLGCEIADRTSGHKVKRWTIKLQAWKLVVTQGLPYHEAAAQLCVSTKAIQRYINRTLESAGSSFPTDLAPAEINKLRQLQSEILLSAMAKVIRQMDAVEKAAGIDADAKLMASSAGLRALRWPTDGSQR